MNALFELLPLILFFAAYLLKDIYFALGVLMVAMPIGLAIKYVRTKKLDKMYFWSTVLLLVAGGLTFYFRDPLFLYWKPTVLSWAFAAGFLASQLFTDKPLAQRFMEMSDQTAFKDVQPSQWKQINLSWVAYFLISGALNIYVAFNFDESVWVKFKVFGLLGLSIVFFAGQAVWLSRIVGDSTDTEQQEQE